MYVIGRILMLCAPVLFVVLTLWGWEQNLAFDARDVAWWTWLMRYLWENQTLPASILYPLGLGLVVAVVLLFVGAVMSARRRAR